MLTAKLNFYIISLFYRCTSDDDFCKIENIKVCEENSVVFLKIDGLRQFVKTTFNESEETLSLPPVNPVLDPPSDKSHLVKCRPNPNLDQRLESDFICKTLESEL